MSNPGVQMKRRKFIKTTAIGVAAVTLPLGRERLFALTKGDPQVVFIKNGEPEALVKAALKELGGISKFISKGDRVVVKPNMGWDRSPELAANTNPDVIAEIVRQCLSAGADSVKVFDRTCNKATGSIKLKWFPITNKGPVLGKFSNPSILKSLTTPKAAFAIDFKIRRIKILLG